MSNTLGLSAFLVSELSYIFSSLFLWGQSLPLLPIYYDPQCDHGHFKDVSRKDALITSGQLAFLPGHFRVLAAAREQSGALDVLWRGLSLLSPASCFSPNPGLWSF